MFVYKSANDEKAKKTSGKNITWQPKSKQNRNQSYQISCIFLKQISNSSQFRMERFGENLDLKAKT